jgi:DNA processing protein
VNTVLTFIRYTFLMHIVSQNDFSSHPLLTRLLELHDIPEKIYIEGTLPHVSLDEYGRATPRILTIVGSRKHTSYAEDVLRHFIDSLSSENVIIISGLALGVDGLAHKQALRNNIVTISIPGSGLDTRVIYPSGHRTLAQDIVSSGGALLSELDPHTRPAQWTFPARNRIMAALSDAILVVEAEEKSGTLITARIALELGRDIGAIPGNIFSSTSTGTNMLIREGAYAITKKEDLFDLLHLSYTEQAELPLKVLTDKEKIIIDLLQEPQEKDLLLIESKLSPTDFLITLSSLEMKGVISEQFGEVRRIV